MNHLLRGSLLLFALLCMTIAASAQTETTIYTFTNGSDGSGPDGGLVSDGHGNFFGTTGETQTTWGTVFELSPASGGGWNLATLYTFQGGSDGASPTAALARDAVGNLYGETVFGGDPRSLYCNGGCGTVFELSPNGSEWQKTTLYQFHGNQPGNGIFDGALPSGGLTLDSAGNIYGTTSSGNGFCPYSDNGCGAVFELSPNGSGGWSETILHRFVQTDGALPGGGVSFDSAGNLYGTTLLGGPSINFCYALGCGTVFKLNPKKGGGWGHTTLHTFVGTDGKAPYGHLVLDSKGNLFGTTYAGGVDDDGVVFKLKPATGGWKETMLHQFHGSRWITSYFGSDLRRQRQPVRSNCRRRELVELLQWWMRVGLQANPGIRNLGDIRPLSFHLH